MASLSPGRCLFTLPSSNQTALGPCGFCGDHATLERFGECGRYLGVLPVHHIANKQRRPRQDRPDVAASFTGMAMDSPDPSSQVNYPDDTDVFGDGIDQDLAFSARQDRNRRLAIFGLVGGFLAVLVVIVAVQWATDTPNKANALPDVTLTTIDGEEFQLTALAGQPTVVNFFASWCAPCRAELPAFEAVSQQVSGSVKFVGINTTEPDVDAARQLLDDTGVTFQVLFGDDGTVYEDIGALALPTTAFVDATGAIVEVHSGALNQTDLESKISEHFG